MFKHLILYTLLITGSNYGSTQTDIQFRLDLLAEDTDYSIETLKYYITSLTIQYEDGSVYTESDSYHLIDLEEKSTWGISVPGLKNKDLKSINFNLGLTFHWCRLG